MIHPNFATFTLSETCYLLFTHKASHVIIFSVFRQSLGQAYGAYPSTCPNDQHAVMTNGADRFTLYSNFLPIDRCGEGDGAGDVEVVGEGAAVYLFGQAVVAGGEMEQADMAIDGG